MSANKFIFGEANGRLHFEKLMKKEDDEEEVDANVQHAFKDLFLLCAQCVSNRVRLKFQACDNESKERKQNAKKRNKFPCTGRCDFKKEGEKHLPDADEANQIVSKKMNKLKNRGKMNDDTEIQVVHVLQCNMPMSGRMTTLGDGVHCPSNRQEGDEKECHLTADGENIPRSKTLEGCDLCVLKPSKNSNVIEEHGKKMNDFHQFKAITGHDYKRSNHDDAEMSSCIWNQFRPQEVEFGATTEMEEEWVHESSRGGMRHSADGECQNKDHVKLDLNKKCTSVLCSNHFTVPLGTPMTRTTTQEQVDEHHEFNHGSCDMEMSKDDDAFFKCNKHDVHAHLELKQAKELGLILNPLDTKCLHCKEKMKSIELFGEFFHRSSPHSKSQDLVKLTMNELWGAFQTKLRRKVNTKQVTEIDDRESDETPTHKAAPDGCAMSSLTKFEEEKKHFKCCACRTAPFLASHVRTHVVDLMNECKDDVVHGHTDGLVMARSKAMHFKISDELGKWKEEELPEHFKVEKSVLMQMN
eukprot:jgi/Bigna1/81049/fgenesh1_pg.77_\